MGRASEPSRPTVRDLKGVLARIRAHLPSLAPGDARVATAVLEHAERVPLMTAGELATLAGTSASTVVRCCQRLGYTGYHMLQMAIARELRPEDNFVAAPVNAGDPPGEILRKVLAADADAMRDAASTVDHVTFESVVTAIAKAPRVLFAGVGTSAPIAQDAAYRFMQIGVVGDAPPDALVQHMAASQLRRKDVCFVVSHSGETVEPLAVARTAKAAGATVVALTSFARSPLAEIADLQLVAGGNQLSVDLEAMSSRIARLAVVDALFVAVAIRQERRSRAALDASGRTIAEHRSPARSRTRKLPAS